MNEDIRKEMEVLWANKDEYDLNQKLAAFGRLKKSASKQDLPQLLETLESNRNNFWTRELLAELICQLGGPEYLPQLFKALSLNEEEGHDSDGFYHSLAEMAGLQPKDCREKIASLLKQPEYKYKKDAKWLLTFCK